MIEVFDETLRELVRREVVNGSQVEIAFDAPRSVEPAPAEMRTRGSSSTGGPAMVF